MVDLPNIRMTIQSVFTGRYARLCDTMEGCLPTIAKMMMESGLIGKHTMKTENYDKIMDDFLAGLEWMNSVSDLESHCGKFVSILINAGPNQAMAGLELKKALQSKVSPICGESFLEKIEHRSLEPVYKDTDKSIGNTQIVENKTVSVSKIFQSHTARLANAITPLLYGLSSTLHAEGLISFATNDEVVNGRDRDMIKANRLVLVLQKQIKGNRDPHSYVMRLCSVFKKQDDETIHDIATTLLKEIEGLSNIVNAESNANEEIIQQGHTDINSIDVTENIPIKKVERRTKEETLCMKWWYVFLIPTVIGIGLTLYLGFDTIWIFPSTDNDITSEINKPYVTPSLVDKNINLPQQFTCSNTPVVSDLQEGLAELVEWERFGVSLGINYSEIQKIKVHCQNQVDYCKLELFNYWLNYDTTATWQKVLDSLSKMNKNRLIVKIRVKYCKKHD